MEPTTARDRIVLLDILRGLAILGMFTVNMTADFPGGSAFREQPFNGLDNAMLILVDLFTNGKFITMFSLLFGIGFFLQLQRAEGEGAPFVAIYLRRLLGLFLIGAIAFVAGINAVILIDYAMFGLVLALLWRRSVRFLLRAAVVCLIIGAVAENYETVGALLVQQNSPSIPAAADSSLAGPSRLEETRQIYVEGSYSEIVTYRAGRLLVYLSLWDQRLRDAGLLALMLLGGYLVRSGAVADAAIRRRVAQAALPWMIGVGGLGMLTFVWLRYFVEASSPVLDLIRSLAFWPIGAPVLGLAYAAIITLLHTKPGCERILRPLAAVGRMALTNYLLHGLVIAVFIYGWGFARFGNPDPSWALIVVAASFSLMVVFSTWWMARFRFGPSEWIWRTLTYGRVQPLSRSEAAASL